MNAADGDEFGAGELSNPSKSVLALLLNEFTGGAVILGVVGVSPSSKLNNFSDLFCFTSCFLAGGAADISADCVNEFSL